MSANKVLVASLLIPMAFTATSGMAADNMDEAVIARGKYIVDIGGCNDCHTPGFGPSEGAVPESEWLQGDTLGYRGPWGTTYPVNLRVYMTLLTEDQWVTVAKSLKTRPPMPFWAVNAMTTDDLRALYRYIRSLGPVEHEIPAYVPPGQEPMTPYIQWPSLPE